MGRKLSCVLGAGLLFAGPALAQDQPRITAADGQELAERWCAACHVVDTTGTGTDAAPPFTVIAQTRSTGWLRSFLAEPHARQMPPLDLSFDEIEALVGYIESLNDRASADQPVFARVAEDRLGDAAAGRALAEEVCAFCHAIPDWEPPTVEAPGASPFETVAADPAITFMTLHAFLRSPHPTMPNIRLSDEELIDVIAYILSLRGAADHT